MPTRNLLTLNKQPRHLAPLFMPGGASYQARLKALFGANLIQYLPLSEGPPGPSSLTFNGTSTKVDCGSGASLDNLPAAGDVTIDLYILADNFTNTVGISKTSGLTTDGFSIYTVNTPNRFRFYVNHATTDAQQSTTAVNAGQWYHLTCFYDFSAKKVRVAVDGTWGSLSSAGAGAYSSDAAASFVIGLVTGSGNFPGKIGWVRISDSDRYDGTGGSNFTAPSRTTTPTVDANTVSLWPMNEGYGTVAGDIGTNDNDGTITDGDWGSYPTADDKSPQANDGAYTGVVLANGALPSKIGGFAPYFDGVNDYVNLYSAGLSSDFNGQLGSIGILAKVAAGFWTDGVAHHIVGLTRTGSERLFIDKTTSNNIIRFQYQAAGTTDVVQVNSGAPYDWFMAVMTWSLAADEVKAFLNGSQLGTTQTGLGTWAISTLIDQYTNIGAYDNAAPSYPGYAGHHFVLNRVATPSEVLQLSQWAGVA